MISKPLGFKLNQKEREKTKARSKTEKANLKQKDKSANDITQIILRSDLLSRIRGSIVVLRDQIHKELGHTIDLNSL